MRQVIGGVLPFAVIVMVSPINIVAAILLLFSKRPMRNAGCYLAGFVVGLTLVVTGLTALAGAVHLDHGGTRARGVSIALVALGAWLIIQAVRKFRGRPTGDDEATLPAWMDGIAAFSPWRSLAVGAGVGAANPKNIAVALGAAATISAAGLAGGQQAVVLAVYVVIACSGVAAPLVAMLVLGARGPAVLEEWKAWLTRNNPAMMAVIFLFFGVYLIGKNLGAV